jgi:hypothetical protein
MGAKQFYHNNTTFNDHEHIHNTEKAQVELPVVLLEKLILLGLIPGNECKCLDDTARKTLWKSILQGSVQTEPLICLKAF